jgi:tetratricopeptide (TPR) repeat protein
MARCYYQRAQYAAAIETIKKLMVVLDEMEMSVSDFRIYDVLGSAHFALSQYTDAAHAYEQAMQYAPETPEIRDKIRLYWHYSLQLMNS